VRPLEDPTSLQPPAQPSLFDPPSKALSLVIPAYNEALRLPQTLEEAVAYLSTRAQRNPDFTWEILVVDDGSTDGGATARIAYDFVRRYTFDQVRTLSR